MRCNQVVRKKEKKNEKEKRKESLLEICMKCSDFLVKEKKGKMFSMTQINFFIFKNNFVCLFILCLVTKC